MSKSPAKKKPAKNIDLSNAGAINAQLAGDAPAPDTKALVERALREGVPGMALVADLVPYATNARTHSEEQVDKLCGSIRAFGFTNPILLWKDNLIIAGHGRWMAAKKLGLPKVPVMRLEYLSETECKQYVLADNRLALDAGWDNEMLSLEMKSLADMGADLSLTGFTEKELQALLAEKTEGLTDEDEEFAYPARPCTKPGDVWLLDGHRIRCGDSTGADDVKALLGSVVPMLMVTDPPYGMKYDPAWRGKAKNADGSPLSTGENRAVGVVQNDDRADWREAWALFPGTAMYVWHSGIFSAVVQASIEESGFAVRAQIIWRKNHFAIGRGDYHPQHEPLFYAVKKNGKSGWNGSRKESTVWDIDKPQKSETGHGTQKPVECMRRPIVNNSSPGQVVYDPFLGSGTTVIAAETEGRLCFGMEIDPGYVDVAVKRWQEFTGKQATLEGDGRTFDEICAAWAEEPPAGTEGETAPERGTAGGKSRKSKG